MREREAGIERERERTTRTVYAVRFLPKAKVISASTERHAHLALGEWDLQNTQFSLHNENQNK
jgi:hypothetical protein